MILICPIWKKHLNRRFMSIWKLRHTWYRRTRCCCRCQDRHRGWSPPRRCWGGPRWRGRGRRSRWLHPSTWARLGDRWPADSGDGRWRPAMKIFLSIVQFYQEYITATASSFLCKNDHMLLLRTKFDSFANAVFMKKSKLLKCNENCEGQRLRWLAVAKSYIALRYI